MAAFMGRLVLEYPTWSLNWLLQNALFFFSLLSYRCFKSVIVQACLQQPQDQPLK